MTMLPNITPEHFERITNDTNGNPRYVTHFLSLDMHRGDGSGLGISERYALAVKFANTLGGRKYHNKKYGGGIVFQSYNLDELCNALNKAMVERVLSKCDAVRTYNLPVVPTPTTDQGAST